MPIMELKAIVIHPIIGKVFEHITEHKKQRRKTMKFIRKKDGEIISKGRFSTSNITTFKGENDTNENVFVFEYETDEMIPSVKVDCCVCAITRDNTLCIEGIAYQNDYEDIEIKIVLNNNEQENLLCYIVNVLSQSIVAEKQKEHL